MVARPGQYQASFNSGELAPATWGRSDIKQFYSGASLMVNAEPVPQGGFDNAPGSEFAGLVRGALGELTPVNPSTTLGPHSVAATIYQCSFAASLVECVDVAGLLGTQALSSLVRVETSTDGVTWAPFGTALSVATSARTRRVAVEPGKGVFASAIRLRLFTNPPSAVTFTLGSVTVLTQTVPTPSAARIFEHTFAVGDAFSIVFTPGHADIWKGANFVAAVAHPMTAAMLPTVGRSQRLNTMLLFHVDLPPHRIMRMDHDGDWSSAPAPLINVPEVDLGGTYTPTIDAWQVWLRFQTGGGAGVTVSIMVNGEETTGVAVPAGPDFTAFATAMKAAIEALPGVEAGIAFSFSASNAVEAIFNLSFTGGRNAGQVFTVVPRVVNSADAAATAVHVTVGKSGGEPIMSTEKGYPASGGYWQDRLYLAGFKAESGSALGSVTGEYFDVNILIENAAGGVLFRLDTDGAERIQNVARSKHLLFFTNEAEYFVSDRAIVRGTPPNVAQSSRNGIAPGIAPVENEGGLLYVGRSRTIAYLATYSDVSQSYESEPISLLASHLVREMRATALQRASQSNDAARYLMVRDDGLLVIGVLIRNQEVVAFVRWQTDGAVRDVCVDGNNEAYMLVERTVGAGTRMMRERLTRDAFLHQQTSRSYETPTAAIGDLGHYEGRDVWAFADGYAEGPLRVTAGAVTLQQPASEVVIGRWVAPIVDTLPAPRLVGERVQLARPVRVHTVRANAIGVTSIAIGANGRPPRDIALLRAGQPSDQPIQPYNGPLVAPGLFGWSDAGIVRLTQVRPGRFAIRDITIEARI